MNLKPLKVSEVNEYIKKLFYSDLVLSDLKVEGEISNFKQHYSGHIYFTLKDEKGKIKCVMFRSYSKNLRINLKDGDKVIATGYVSIYDKEGNYQLYVKKIEKSGIGELYEAFEKLKLKLEKEGLFNQENKKQIPTFPKKIGVVTSPTGAAIKDIIKVIKRRFPIVDILIYPVLVQGIYAVDTICKGLNYLDSREDIDLIIVGRGGGSLEELFCFNDERIARTIYRIEKPVISAVGHEIDITITDFVADMRAPTPSAAAEMATPELKKLLNDLFNNYNILIKSINYIIENNKTKLGYMYNELKYYNPVNKMRDMMQQQDSLFKRLMIAMEYKLKVNKYKINNMFSILNYLNPVSSLKRGYGIIMDLDGNIITTVDSINKNEELNVVVKDGSIKVKVVNISKGEFNYEN